MNVVVSLAEPSNLKIQAAAGACGAGYFLDFLLITRTTTG